MRCGRTSSRHVETPLTGEHRTEKFTAGLSTWARAPVVRKPGNEFRRLERRRLCESEHTTSSILLRQNGVPASSNPAT